MSTIRELQKFFPTGTTEGEREILQSVFIYSEAFDKIISPPANSPRILVGTKGSGKIALLQFLSDKCAKEQIPFVSMTPDDFDLSKFPVNSNLAEIKRLVFEYLILHVASKLATQGLVLSKHDNLIYQAKKKLGKGDSDAIEKLFKILNPIGKSLSGFDFASMLPNDTPDSESLSKAIRTSMSNNQRFFYLVIDDTDQIGTASDPLYLNRIWGLLLGVRKLAERLPHLKCIVTLRTEIWRRLKYDKANNLDQIDHFQPLICDLQPRNQFIENIWRKRLQAAAGSPGNQVIRYFAQETVTLPGSIEVRSWGDFLSKNSRERPRDMVQLMQKLISKALDNDSSKITSNHLESIIFEYSRERVDYTCNEFQGDCTELNAIFHALSSLNYRESSDSVLSFLEKLPSSFAFNIRGKSIKANRHDAFQTWQLLHEAGVLNARALDSRNEKNYRHINYADDQGLVSISRWNDMQKYQWEIHPVYRSFFESIKENESARKYSR